MSVAARTTVEIPNRRSGLGLAFWDRLGIALSGLALVVGTVAVLYTLVLGINWYSQPFLGAMTSSTLVVNGTRPLGSETWNGLQAGLRPNDRILNLDGVQFDGTENPGML